MKRAHWPWGSLETNPKGTKRPRRTDDGSVLPYHPPVHIASNTGGVGYMYEGHYYNSPLNPEAFEDTAMLEIASEGLLTPEGMSMVVGQLTRNAYLGGISTDQLAIDLRRLAIGNNARIMRYVDGMRQSQGLDVVGITLLNVDDVVEDGLKFYRNLRRRHGPR